MNIKVQASQADGQVVWLELLQNHSLCRQRGGAGGSYLVATYCYKYGVDGRAALPALLALFGRYCASHTSLFSIYLDPRVDPKRQNVVVISYSLRVPDGC